MAEHVFCDGVQNVSFADGCVRLSFFVLSAAERDKAGRPARQACLHIAMPPGGFLATAQAMQNLVKQLTEKGVVRPRQKVTVGPAQLAPKTGNGPEKKDDKKK